VFHIHKGKIGIACKSFGAEQKVEFYGDLFSFSMHLVKVSNATITKRGVPKKYNHERERARSFSRRLADQNHQRWEDSKSFSKWDHGLVVRSVNAYVAVMGSKVYLT
jgi:hypothetical protein